MKVSKQQMIEILKKKLFCSSCDKEIDELFQEDDICRMKICFIAQCHNERVGCQFDPDDFHKNVLSGNVVKSYIDFPSKIKRLENEN